MDVEILSRVQFALTIMVHYLFPPLTIGLGAVMVGLESMYVLKKDARYRDMAKFWTKLFTVNFGLGVATGIVMEFEFGTNWAAYSRYVGDVFGSALAAEGIFAFFLESGFLAVLVFGWDRVGPRMHLFATWMVFLGSVFSSIWIVIANSWMQTPAGFHIVGEGLQARAEIVDFWAMVFNPSSVARLLHVWVGALILGSFFVLSICAWYLLKKRHLDFARGTFKVALVLATFSSLAALFTGHLQADIVAEHQPAKLAAFEGHYRTGAADMYLWGIPDDDTGGIRFGIKIPQMLSWLVHGDTNASVTGLDAFPREDWPNTTIVFQTYHLMVAIGIFFIALTLLSCVLWWRGSLFNQRWLLWTYVGSVLLAYIGNQVGWISTEVGRQPWIVYNLLRTSDALSESVTAQMVISSIALFGFIYALIVALWLFVMNHKIQAGPQGFDTRSQDPSDEGWTELAAERLRHRKTSLWPTRRDSKEQRK